MGAGISGLGGGDEKFAGEGGASIEDLPESCIALILTHLDSTEVCEFAGLNRTFRQASIADVVWLHKLPENYDILVKKYLRDDDNHGLTKKELFARLCRPIHFGSSKNKAFWLEKSSRGGVCVCISWKEMKITGIEDRRYWSHLSCHESRFDSVAFLKQIWWVEVEGNLEFEFPAGNYSLFFRLQLGKPSTRHAVEKGHGWNIKPVQFKLSSSKGQHATAQYYLNEAPPGKWINYHVGDFVVDNYSSTMPTKLKFSMTQIDCTHTKGGLCLDSVLILPAAHIK